MLLESLVLSAPSDTLTNDSSNSFSVTLPNATFQAPSRNQVISHPPSQSFKLNEGRKM